MLGKNHLSSPFRRSRFTKNSGFTLLELLITLGIAAVALSIGGLYLGGIHDRGRLQTDAENIVVLLRTAEERSLIQDSASRWGVFIDHPMSVETPSTYTLYKASEMLLADPEYVGVPGSTTERLPLSSASRFLSPVAGSNLNIIFSKGTGMPNVSTTLELASPANASTSFTIFISGNGRIEYR